MDVALAPVAVRHVAAFAGSASAVMQLDRSHAESVNHFFYADQQIPEEFATRATTGGHLSCVRPAADHRSGRAASGDSQLAAGAVGDRGAGPHAMGGLANPRPSAWNWSSTLT